MGIMAWIQFHPIEVLRQAKDEQTTIDFGILGRCYRATIRYLVEDPRRKGLYKILGTCINLDEPTEPKRAFVGDQHDGEICLIQIKQTESPPETTPIQRKDNPSCTAS